MLIKVSQATPLDEAEEFRAARVQLIRKNEQPIVLCPGPKFVLHVIPTNALSREPLDATVFDVNRHDVVPMASSGWGHQVNFDGIAAVESDAEKGVAYTQLFHDGTIEAVNCRYFNEVNGQAYIPFTGWNDELRERLPNYLNIERNLDARLPLYLGVSLIDVKGYKLAVGSSPTRSSGRDIDRNDLLIPIFRTESFDFDTHDMLAKVFERLANAAGLRDLGSR